MEFDNGCRVEVSGWDEKENFFVEKAYLRPETEGGKEIALKNSLHEGCVLFVRELRTTSIGGDFPIAYQAINATAKDSDGRTHVGLQQLRPKARYYEGTHPLDQSSGRIA